MDRPFVIDAVTHPYNFSQKNLRGRFGRMFNDVMYSFYPLVNPPEIAFSRESWERDWQPEEFAETMFLESDTDVACVHSLPIYDAYADGLSSIEKGATLKKDYPDRVIWYGCVDMFEPESALESLEEQIELGADGVKLYPARYDEGKTHTWRMDDEELAFPIFDLAQRRGLRNVAVHKALPLGPVSSESQRVDDISHAANAFPDLNFQIIHAGFMFVDETKFLMMNHPNVYATLEASFLFCILNPVGFTALLGEFLAFGGPDRVIYASAACNPHPQVLLDAFANFEMPEGSPLQLTDELRAAILGGNLARLHGIDVEERRKILADDRFSKEKAEDGLRAPWTAVHAAGAGAR